MEEFAAGGAWPGALAVSGGGDSMALLHLLARWAQKTRKTAPLVLVVDHGLRPESAKQARDVVKQAKLLGLTATLLRWKDAPARGIEAAARAARYRLMGAVLKRRKLATLYVGHTEDDQAETFLLRLARGSGIEAAARAARYRLMGAWLAKHKVATLFVGHTQDDQAETFLLRLARGSGLDGLAAMRARAPWPIPGFAQLAVARPLLTLRREALRAYLQSLGQTWLDDPMNDDAAFDRVKIRKAAAVLDAAGLSPQRIAAAAAHLARARESLEIVTEAVLARAVHNGDGEGVLLDPKALAAAPREVGLRALASVLMAVGDQAYRPRFESLERLFDRIAGADFRGGATLHGCHIRPLGRKNEKDFAPFTLVVRPESPRKSGSSAASET